MTGEHPQMWAQQIQYIIAMAKKDGCELDIDWENPLDIKVTKNGETFEVKL